MDEKPAHVRYPLSRRFPALVRIFGVLLVAAGFYDPVTDLLLTGSTQLIRFVPLAFAVLFSAFVIRFVNVYLELTPTYLLIHGMLTERIPLKRIQSVELPGPWERVDWTTFISAGGRSWGKGWIKASSGNILVLTVGTGKIAIRFSDVDARPPYEEIRTRIEALRAAQPPQE